MKRKICFVFQPSPLLGRMPLTGRGFYANLVDPETFVDALNTEIKLQSLNWEILLDATESDGRLLASRGIDALVCDPGLRFTFIRDGFDKHTIVYLDALTYTNLKVSKVIGLLKSIPGL